TDIFSLGIILFELLSGKHPFGPVPLGRNGRQLRALLLERLPGGPASLLRLNPSLGRGLAQVVERCLRFRPEDRPTAAELAAQLLQRVSAIKVDGRILTAKGYCLARQGYHAEAESAYRQAIRDANCETVAVYNNLAFSLIRMAHHAEARAALERAVELDPKSA